MHKRIALLIAGLTLCPAAAQAACRLDQATFRPALAQHAYVLRSARDGDVLLFDLIIQKTRETFHFKVDVDAHTGEGTITSVADSAGRDPGIRTSFKLMDVSGQKTGPQGAVGQVSFLDLRQGFIKFRLRASPQPEHYTAPPSGLWKVTECRTN